MGSIFLTHVEIKALVSGTSSGAGLAHTSPQDENGQALTLLKANCPKEDSTWPRGCGSISCWHWRISEFMGHLYSIPMVAATMGNSMADGGAQTGAEKWKHFHSVVKASINQLVKWMLSPRTLAGMKLGAQMEMSECLVYSWRIFFLFFLFLLSFHFSSSSLSLSLLLSLFFSLSVSLSKQELEKGILQAIGWYKITQYLSFTPSSQGYTFLEHWYPKFYAGV